MQISTAFYFQNTSKQLSDLQTSLAQTQNQLSTGKQITQPSDAPDQAAALTRLQSDITRQEGYQTTLTTVNDRLTSEETALTSASDVMTRIKELATEAASDTLSASDRSSIAVELGTLRDQLVSLANAQDGSGNYVFAGSNASQPAYAQNASGQVVYQGDQTRMQVNVGDDRQLDLNMPGTDAFVNVVRTDANGKPYGVNFFQALDDLTQAVSNSDQANIQRGISEVNTLSDGISQGLGEVGANQSVSDMQSSVLDAVKLTLQTSQSGIQDLDYNTAATRMNQEELALQAVQNTFAQIAQMSLFKYLS